MFLHSNNLSTGYSRFLRLHLGNSCACLNFPISLSSSHSRSSRKNQKGNYDYRLRFGTLPQIKIFSLPALSNTNLLSNGALGYCDNFLLRFFSKLRYQFYKNKNAHKFPASAGRFLHTKAGSFPYKQSNRLINEVLEAAGFQPLPIRISSCQIQATHCCTHFDDSSHRKETAYVIFDKRP